MGDEQETMSDRYLLQCDLLILEEDGQVRGLCAVSKEGEGLYELQNIAVPLTFSGRGMAERWWSLFLVAILTARLFNWALGKIL